MQPGTRLNHYEIVVPLGEGGMGRVYRAEDTRLKRQVAIKVLPAEVADDADRLARLQREAQVLAQLDHPNVAGVFGLEECELDGRTERFLVMQLAEGETLAERLTSGALAVDEAIEVARQVALGLEAAHARAIVHRDLKPANIMLGPSGDVKILDFGLAKAIVADGGSSKFSRELTASPTVMAATAAGVILGTAPYMSPEQARGKPVDRRADLWALGCVIYEMLAGKRAFDGETATDVIASVVQREPDWEALPAGVPAGFRQLLRRLLAKDPAQRLRDAGDVALVLREAGEADDVTATSGHPASGRGAMLPWLLAAAAALAAVATFLLRPAPPEASVPLRLSALLPTGLGVPTLSYLDSNSLATVALSPDASQLVFVGHDANKGNLYLRRLDEFESTLLPGTLGAVAPFFSADGRQVAFFAGSGLWRIELPGGAPARIAPGSLFAEGGSWTDDDRIVYTPNFAEALWVVPVAGGEPRRLTTLDVAAGETSHRWPHVLPGGRAVLFVIKTATMESLDAGQVAIADLATGEHRVLLDGGTRPYYLDSGQLVFARDTRLYAAPFDLEAGEMRGPPVPVLDGVITSPSTGNAYYAATRSGALAYISGGPAVLQNRVYRLSSMADPVPLPIAPGPYVLGDLSPDGRRLLLGVPAANDKLWVADLAGGLTRLTSGAGNDQPGAWSPDGRWVIFASDRAGGFVRLYRAPLTGSEPPRPLLENITTSSRPGRVSSGAGLLGYEAWNESSGNDAYVLPIAADGSPAGEPVLVAGGPDDQSGVAPSPDGSLVAYTSTETGEPGLYVTSLRSGQRTRVATASGSAADWGEDGRRLFFTSGRKIYFVEVIDAESLTFGEPQRLRGELEYRDFVVDGQGVLASGAEDYLGLRSEIRLDLEWGQRLSAASGERR